jgi:L-lactate dehydrogenase complex protein LldE
MDVVLFVPCYVDQLAPQVAVATTRLLERLGCQVHYDPEQTCCGQPFLNAGLADDAAALAQQHLDRFAGADTIVCPSGSCVATVRHRFPELGIGRDRAESEQRRRTLELGEFLVEKLGRTELGARFPHRVALLESCHGLRDLGLGRSSERAGVRSPSSSARLLAGVEGLTLVEPQRADDCCGFGGSFSVKYPTISTRMGRSRLADFEAAGAEFVTGTDVSCLIHLEGLRRRIGTGPRALHLAEILAADGAIA